MTLSELKFTEEELAAKSVTALEDRPQLSAAEMKAKLDSGDIRERFNQAMDLLQEERKRLFVLEKLDGSVIEKLRKTHGDGIRFFAFFLDSGETFFGDLSALEGRLSQ